MTPIATIAALMDRGRGIVSLRSGTIFSGDHDDYDTSKIPVASAFVLGLGFASLSGIVAAKATETIKLGVMGGDEEEIAEVAQKVAAKNGLDIKLVTFSDYTIPNEALEHGDLDANASSRATGRLMSLSCMARWIGSGDNRSVSS
jgi:hypothetical protein